MHNYAGNPASFPSSIGLLDDADLNPATASTINTAPEGNADRTAWLYNRIGPGPGINWHPLITTVTPPGGGGSAAAGQNCMYFDIVNDIWWTVFIDGNFPTVDGGVVCSTSGLDGNSDTWFQFGGSGGPSTGLSGFGGVDFPSAFCLVAGSTTTYAIAIVSPGATRSKILTATPTSGSWTSALAFPGSSTITSINMDSGGGAMVAGVGSTDTANTNIWSSTDGITWGSQAVGSVIGIGAEILIKKGILTSTFGWIAMPMQAAVFESGTPFAYWTSTNGTTWTQRSLSGVIANTEVPQGLAFGTDTVGPCWILATIQGTTQSKFYRSTDGIAWTAIASTFTRFIQDLICVDTLWAATVIDASTTSPPGGIYGTPPATTYGGAGASYVVISTNGAQTWSRTQATLTKNLTSTGRQQRAKLASSNAQLCLFNSLQMRFSNVMVPTIAWT